MKIARVILGVLIASATAACGGDGGGAGGAGGTGGAGNSSSSSSTSSTGTGGGTTSSSSSSGGNSCPPGDLTCNLPAAVAHCDTSATLGFCTEYYHDCVAGQSVQDGCQQFGGTFAAGACPATNRLGYCIDSDLVQSTLALYPFMGMTEALAKSSCEGDGGTWCSSAP